MFIYIFEVVGFKNNTYFTPWTIPAEILTHCHFLTIFLNFEIYSWEINFLYVIGYEKIKYDSYFYQGWLPGEILTHCHVLTTFLNFAF